ncbi:MAG TPA: hypothetical protein VNO34_10995 [Actinomycetota bacterium]|nr:hypothetical protein [Actinomycetota bacterium]
MRRGARRLLALSLALAWAAGACTGGAGPTGPGPGPTGPTGPATEGSPSPPGSRARPGPDAPECPYGPAPSPRPPAAAPLPGPLAEVARQVEEVRGLRFERPVPAQPVTQARIGELVTAGIRRDFPREVAERRERAWALMGAIPQDSDLFRSVVDFAASQVVGFYDTVAKRLVFVGDPSPSPLARLTLAHELTHALQDQRFDLTRLDALGRACRDEEASALQALVEGDAQDVSIRWAQRHLSLDEVLELQLEAGALAPPPASVPPFVEGQFLFPYEAGQRFVRALLARGGQEALDRAFQDPPRSTEQVLHPERFPNDAPQAVAVPDFAQVLGPGWEDLDFQDVGEGWLQLYLGVELPESRARAAAAGWDGGQYRAWTDGERVALVLDTVWDSEADAREFADAVQDLGEGRPVRALVRGAAVRVLYASDQATLGALAEAA